MQLILWRHADAEDGGGKPDAERDLTKKGRKQAERMARWLRPRLDAEWRILVSPARRTLQTVAPLELPFETDERVGLAATAGTVLAAAQWPNSKRGVVVVGHQPTLGQTAATLIGGEQGDISIKKGAVWWFAARRRDGAPETLLKLVIGPDEVEDEAE